LHGLLNALLGQNLSGRLRDLGIVLFCPRVWIVGVGRRHLRQVLLNHVFQLTFEVETVDFIILSGVALEVVVAWNSLLTTGTQRT